MTERSHKGAFEDQIVFLGLDASYRYVHFVKIYIE